jgi:predicted nucleotidyltransferase component of viral defense system
VKDSPFFKQAELMLRVIPYVASESCFALKGGTAINLFVRDMPRLSVDIDLCYVPIESRETSLKNMTRALREIADAIRNSLPGIKVQESYARGSRRIVKLFVGNPGAQIKVEPNEVLRGTVFPCTERVLSEKAEELFELSASINTLSFADLYGGKLCAASDRQHPRDLFDIKILMDNEGITDEVRRAFVIYLAGHDRPMNELIDPTRKDMRRIYEQEFSGMASVAVEYENLVEARENFIEILKKQLTNKERQFLLSIKKRQPKWDLIEMDGIQNLPAIQWKLLNVQKMDAKLHARTLEKLKTKLEL